MSYYGGTVTVAGRNLITSLMAGKTIEFTRIEVGSGAMPEGVEPIDMTALVTPVAEGVSTVPIVENGVLNMVVEYRNDLNGGLTDGFWLREFGVFAKTEDTEETLLYYATLGDSPQPVNAYKDNRIDIRRYPITIALELDADVQVTYNPGAFVTAGEAQELVQGMVNEATKGLGSTIIKDITIPADIWTAVDEPQDKIAYSAELVDADIRELQAPVVSLHKESLDVADKAGVCQSAQTMDGRLIMWSRYLPKQDLTATLILITPSEGATGSSAYVLPIASATRLGGVKIGKGVSITADGTISVSGGGIGEDDIATAEEMESMLDQVFPEEEGGGSDG